MRRKIKKMDCIEYLSVQAPLEKVNMLEDKQSKYIHEFVKRKEYSIVGKIRRNGFSQRDVDRQWNQKKEDMVSITNLMSCMQILEKIHMASREESDQE